MLAHKDYWTGIGLLLIVVFLWTSSNFVTQDLFKGGYAKPFLVTYLNTSAFALYLIPFWLRARRRPKEGEYRPLRVDPLEEEFQEPQDESTRPLTQRETAQLASMFCLLWFVANWTVNASLDYTSVASSTVLSSTSGFFTMAIGRLFHVERMSLVKMGGVVASFVGVIIVSYSDASVKGTEEAGLSHAVLGDAFALLSALFYALYVTLLKVRIQSESRIDMQLFFGFVGLFNLLGLWPFALLLHWAGVEQLELPSGRNAVAALLINMAITLSSDYIYVIAMLKTTPLVVTVGLSLTIPLAVIGDFLLGHTIEGRVILGAFLVLASFVVVGLNDTDANDHDRVD